MLNPTPLPSAIRRLSFAALAIAFLSPLSGVPIGPSPALAQAPPPVPALPDTERRVSYSISASTCTCSITFALYGDSTDYQDWIEVWLNGVRVNYNDATSGWTVTSNTGSLATIPRPITDAIVTFNSVQTGTVQIIGARRPRRTSQFAENRGVAARDLNQALTDIIAGQREIWDKTNDVTGRGLFSQPGNTIGRLPLPSACTSAFLAFDSTGLNPVCTTVIPGTGPSSVISGPVSSTVGHIATWNNGTGTALIDSGVFPINGLIDVKAAYGVKCDGSSNDTAAIVTALSSGSGKNLLFPAGTCITDPVTISLTNANAPQSILAYGTVFQARASSASPTLLIENVQGLLTHFAIYGLKLDAHSLHAYPLKIHGGQHYRLQDIEATGGTTGGIWLSGEPNFGIYYSIFDHVYSHANTGQGWILKSINNSGQYYIANNAFINPRSISNTTYGYDLDYATVDADVLEAELNSTCGVNINNSIAVEFRSPHLEQNNGTDCSINSTTPANTTGLAVSGGRTTGTITAALESSAFNSFNTSDSNANPIKFMAGSKFVSTGIQLPAASGLGLSGSTPIADAINSGANGIALAVSGSTKAVVVNGVTVGSPTGGDKGAGTVNVSSAFYVNGVVVGGVGSVSNSDGTLTISPTTGAVVASLALGHPNTWTAAQTFNSGDIQTNGATSGVLTLLCTAVCGTTTATFPANTGPVAELNFAQTWTALQTFVTGDLAINSGSTTAGLATVSSAGVLSSEATATLAQMPAFVLAALGYGGL